MPTIRWRWVDFMASYNNNPMGGCLMKVKGTKCILHRTSWIRIHTYNSRVEMVQFIQVSSITAHFLHAKSIFGVVSFVLPHLSGAGEDWRRGVTALGFWWGAHWALRLVAVRLFGGETVTAAVLFKCVRILFFDELPMVHCRGRPNARLQWVNHEHVHEKETKSRTWYMTYSPVFRVKQALLFLT